METATPKKIICGLLLAVMTLSMNSCMVSHHHHHKSHKLPPGQAKKISGDKSAKRHAPGHNK